MGFRNLNLMATFVNHVARQINIAMLLELVEKVSATTVHDAIANDHLSPTPTCSINCEFTFLGFLWISLTTAKQDSAAECKCLAINMNGTFRNELEHIFALRVATMTTKSGLLRPSKSELVNFCCRKH